MIRGCSRSGCPAPIRSAPSGITAAAPASSACGRRRIVGRVGSTTKPPSRAHAWLRAALRCRGRASSSPMTSSLIQFEAGFLCETAANRLIGGVAAGRVRQQRVARPVDVIEHRLATDRDVDPADRDGDHLGARASCACTITAFDGYLPVPTISRDVNVRPARTKASMAASPRPRSSRLRLRRRR